MHTKLLNGNLSVRTPTHVNTSQFPHLEVLLHHLHPALQNKFSLLLPLIVAPP
jgi:hypothetical protein